MSEYKEIVDSVNALKIEIVKLPDVIMEKAETKFASKLTEKIVYGLCGFILLGFFGVVFTLVTNAK